ncbi:SDR family NAD(P)-dependent oxidoreductase [Grimontia hollisae]|uniref:Nucleoside-diphosphate-sugar epimerase n=4 Tax=Grimontia hollisae TaxID=673 RepID=D0I6P7_GRIHO|nr:SDR family oxidoreductase [Grimontia hollisae]AMG32207.1 SDR family NAD(P)-dependent oxidoreductase [Grimontia hollisae]EEY72316.1 nucleoside-diphosphate-sugar epimerase [Grimontia hollisae CIP 101886]MDF2185868.1 SDR family oxidoreductase [Grimontia hollisae]STO45495.1 Uncharacterised protein [Grimontia hollisae]STO57903.1 Uncharacterised protein [Grimontia hollisae]
MSKPYKTVSIIGCGWLGLPLAESMREVGYSVVGSKRNPDSLALLTSKRIHSVVFDIFSHEYAPESIALFGSDVLVANIPPGRRTVDSAAFVQAMKKLVDSAKSGGVKQFIFISTTSVYGNVTGKVTESTVCKPDTASGKMHREIEDYMLSQFPEGGVVLRLSGLVGGERHPGKYLAGREDISNGKDPVNLVHRDDCIGAIIAIVKKQIGGDILHLSALEHPSRSAFYRWAAKKMGLEEPSFIEDGGEGKYIDPYNTLKLLGLTLIYPSPFDMPVPDLH